METIRNYLETMFATLPATPEVHKAKQELLSMMEDKYTELVEEGKPENEAVAVVISEFGNLDELAETLGIGDVVVEQKVEPKDIRQISLEEAKDFIEKFSLKQFWVGIGVLCFILSPASPIILGAFHIPDAVGMSFFFMLIAAGIGIIIAANSLVHKYKYIRQQPCMLDYQTTGYVQDQMQSHHSTKTLLHAIGVSLFVMCFIPLTLLDNITSWAPNISAFADLDEIGGFFMFLFIGIGVWLVIYSDGKTRACKLLLQVNPKGTISETYVKKEEKEEKEIVEGRPALNVFLGEYWFTVTCLYLIVSFLTFKWWITWIIWPLAAVIRALIIYIAQKDGEKHE